MNSKRFLAAALAAAMLTLTACSAQTEPASSAPAAPSGIAVQVQEVAVKDISSENKVSGKTVAESETAIMVATTAKCTAVYKQAGDPVEAGDVICTLDLAATIANYNAANINYQSAVQQYNSQKAILDKQISLARDNVNNLKALFEIGAASQLEIDQAELTLAQAEAGRDSALAQLEAGMQSGVAGLEQLDMILENVDPQGNVIAPISGTLVSLSAVAEGYISASMPVAVIDGAEQMKITVSVSEALVPKLAIGDEADVYVGAAEASFVSTIRAVEKSANMQTKLYTVTLNVPAEVDGLLSGMFADVTFRTDTVENTVVVPTEAILTSAGKQHVFVVENDKAKYVEVTTGLAGTGVTQVTSGLTGGEILVTVGQSYLADGDAVRVVSGEG